jgi:tRNA(adenine34) deaminase
MAQAAKKWVRKVKTDSTHPPEGLFTKDPETIAKKLASKQVSPKGPGSGMRMLIYYINRAGKSLTARRKYQLEKAKGLRSERVQKTHQKERKDKS